MNKDKIILDLCAGTGAWSKPYRDNGYDVRLITLPMFDITDKYVQEQCVNLKPYGILVAPPCTMFSLARMNAKTPRDLESSMKIVIACLNIIWGCQYKINKPTAHKTILKFWVLENPNGFLKYFLGNPMFEFNPYDFADMYKKKTHLWGWFNLPEKTWFIKPDVEKFSKQSKRDTNKIASSYIKSIGNLESWKNPKTRQEVRGITPQGFAKAFYEANK